MRAIYLLSILLGAIINLNTVFAEKKTIKIASGNIVENYFAVALTICDFIEKSNNVTCQVIPTNGSQENLKLLNEGKVDLVLIQSNIATDAYNAHGIYDKSLPNSSLRQILNLYDEVFIIITKDDDKIKVFADIAGKRIVNGTPESASGVTYEAIKHFYSFAKPQDIELDHENYAKKLCDGDVDVIMLMTGLPNALVSLIANSCEIDFAAIEQEKLSKIIDSNKAYKKVTLTQGIYPGITTDQDTVGVQAILVSNDKLDSSIVRNFEKYFAKNAQKFKQSNPLLNKLDEDRFFKDFVLPKLEAAKL